MSTTSLRELHLETSFLIGRVENGETIVIEKLGVPIAEIRPIAQRLESPRLPDRSSFFRRLPAMASDSGRFLEEDRT